MFTPFKDQVLKATLLAMLVSLPVFAIALAAPGDLDTSFSGDGLVMTDVNANHPGQSDIAEDIAIQADGKILAAGYSSPPSATNDDFALTRYKSNGSLDTAFSGDGKLITNFGNRDFARSLLVQPDGKIVAAGSTCSVTCDLALARYTASGALDIAFSGDGKLQTDFGGDDNGSDQGLAIQANGRIVVAGYMWNGANYDFAVYRYLPNGSPDTTFSGDGKVNFGFGAVRDDRASAIATREGKIIVAGSTSDVINGYDFAVARLNADGSLDATFSGDGRQVTNFGANEIVYGLALRPDGKIILVGEKNTAAFDFAAFAMARYNSEGTLDDTFGHLLPSGKRTGRKVFSIVPGEWSLPFDVLVQPNGRIVVAGGTGSEGGPYDFALVRLTQEGAFDTAFSGDGKVTVDFGNDDLALALIRQPSDGKYVLGGYTFDGMLRDFGLARLLP